MRFNYFILQSKYPSVHSVDNNLFIPTQNNTLFYSFFCFLVVNNSNAIRLPFNWKTPVGYVLATAFQLITFFGVLEIFATILIIYIAICQFAVAFTDDIKKELRQVDRSIANCRGVFSSEERTQLKAKLGEIIELHWNAIRLSSIEFKGIRCPKIRFYDYNNNIMLYVFLYQELILSI